MEHEAETRPTTTNVLTEWVAPGKLKEVNSSVETDSLADVKPEAEAVMEAMLTSIAGDADKHSEIKTTEKAAPGLVAVDVDATNDVKEITLGFDDGAMEKVITMSEIKPVSAVYMAESVEQMILETSSDLKSGQVESIEALGDVKVENVEVDKEGNTIDAIATKDTVDGCVTDSVIETTKVEAAIDTGREMAHDIVTEEIGSKLVLSQPRAIDDEAVMFTIDIDTRHSIVNVAKEEGADHGDGNAAETEFQPKGESEVVACGMVSAMPEIVDFEATETILTLVSEPISKAIDNQATVTELQDEPTDEEINQVISSVDETKVSGLGTSRLSTDNDDLLSKSESDTKETSQLDETFQVETDPINPVATLIKRYEQIARRKANKFAQPRHYSQTSLVSPQSSSPPSSLNVFEATAKRNEEIEMAKMFNEEKICEPDTYKTNEKRVMNPEDVVDNALQGETTFDIAIAEEAFIAVQDMTQDTNSVDICNLSIGDESFASAGNIPGGATDERSSFEESSVVEPVLAGTETSTEERPVETTTDVQEEAAINELDKRVEGMSEDENALGNATESVENFSDDDGIKTTTTLFETTISCDLTDNQQSNHEASTCSSDDHYTTEVVSADFSTNETLNESVISTQPQESLKNLGTSKQSRDMPAEVPQNDFVKPDIYTMANMEMSPTTKGEARDVILATDTSENDSSQQSLPPVLVTYEILGVTRVNNVIMYHIYSVNTATNERVPVSSKRYSEFKLLVEQLRFLNTPEAYDLPELPKPNIITFLRGRRNQTTIEQREKAFADILCYISKHPELHTSAIFQSFIAK
ncbi:Phox homologous domain [Plasmopara halstedii]|uniref:Phox homologous domain n=1 Tax=Plasmopara halstedii TaxID=4781 RepID=A0A0P1AFT0_PLAHL|nr:Phox homologous domain [Plasmopara halstedii]CEG39967.1 Phox homologous domain [Plasmopara halstedii]|eukprot:XP_024576336.1 Phox homologous domain [Plasmopara halstedii]